MAIHKVGAGRRSVLAAAFVRRTTPLARILVALLAVGLASGQSPAFAGEPPAREVMTSSAGPIVIPGSAPGVIANAVAREAERWSLDTETVRQSAAEPSPQERSWLARNAVLVGALAGAGAGAGIGYALGQDCSGPGSGHCSSKGGAAAVGALLFGGAGAAVGWVVQRTTR